MALDSVEKKKVCPIDGQFLSRSGMNNHIKLCHVNQNWTCDMCPKIFKTKLEKNNHIKRVHMQKTFTCDKCDKTFKTNSNLKRHIAIEHDKKTFCCKICGKNLASRATMKTHYDRCKALNISKGPSHKNFRKFLIF